jgi:hypothetical protein
VEVFRITAWGAVPALAQLAHDFPPLLKEASALEAVEARLRLWSRE